MEYEDLLSKSKDLMQILDQLKVDFHMECLKTRS
jgi:hypothetical protein